MARRTLKSVSIVSYCVDRIATVESAWRDYLGYRTVARGELTRDECVAWNTPESRGQTYCLMQPASEEPIYLRFIETGERLGYESPATCGWLATEMLVEDPDALARRLDGSPFELIGGPANLFPGEKAARAMQMVGPSGQLLYFTRILPGGSRYGLKGARCDVDRPFIVAVAGAETSRMSAFYRDTLGMRVFEPIPFLNRILARACRVSADTIFATSVSPIPGRRFLIELDEFPPGTARRPRQPGQLPRGMSMVSFLIPDLDAVHVRFRAAPRTLETKPYDGRRSAVVEGPSGEWLELIEDPAA